MDTFVQRLLGLSLLGCSVFGCSVGSSILGPADDGQMRDAANDASNDAIVDASPEASVDAAPDAPDAQPDAPPSDGACSVGQLRCSGECVPSDERNCGSCGVACSSSQVCVNGACIGTGVLRFTATWEPAGDVDLHVVPPCGTSIHWRNRTACSGELDRDDRVGTGPENVFWATEAERGTYLVCAVPFLITSPTTVTVQVYEGSTLRQTWTRTNALSMPTESCTRSSPTFLGEFVR